MASGGCQDELSLNVVIRTNLQFVVFRFSCITIKLQLSYPQASHADDPSGVCIFFGLSWYFGLSQCIVCLWLLFWLLLEPSYSVRDRHAESSLSGARYLPVCFVLNLLSLFGNLWSHIKSSYQIVFFMWLSFIIAGPSKRPTHWEKSVFTITTCDFIRSVAISFGRSSLKWLDPFGIM